MQVFSSQFSRFLQEADRKIAFWSGPMLVVIAVFYYAAYINFGLNLGGEGGTTGVLALRLMEGQRPIVDTFLGYNVLWFYPVVWLFHCTGPDYLALRAFFFGLALLAALFGAATVWKVSRCGLLTFCTGLLLVLIPGMLFRNYMGLLAVMNQFVLLCAFVLPVRSSFARIAWIAVSGLVLGITFLVRVEVGCFMAVIWLGLLVLFPLIPGTSSARWKQVGLGGILGVLLFILIHTPFAIDAHKREYAREFYGQYTAVVGMMLWKLEAEIQAWLPGQKTTGAEQLDAAARVPSDVLSEPETEAVRESWRPRPPVSQILLGKGQRERYFAAAVYLPVAAVILLVVWGGFSLVQGWWKKDPEVWADGLCALVLTGCSLTLFPQFFFFRPDTPHLVEFMIPLLPAAVCVSAIMIRRAVEVGNIFRWAFAGIAVVALVFTVWMHFGHAWPKESAGTIAAKKPDTVSFVAQNGVHVQIPEKEAEALNRLRDAILNHSSPDDWLVCFPYSPTINFMTARRSYLWNLHMDDSMAGEPHQRRQIEWMETNRPAVIVVDHRAVNKTARSRFKNWASLVYEHIRKNYHWMGTFGENEVYVRPDKLVGGKREQSGL